jgi:hypothetical protein
MWIARVGSFGLLAACRQPIMQLATLFGETAERLLVAGAGGAESGVRATWGFARPVDRPSAAPTVFGIALMLGMIVVMVANYRLLQTTLPVLLPFERASSAVALCVVTAGMALGITWHYVPRLRWLVVACGVLLVCIVAKLAVDRAAAIVETTDLGAAPSGPGPLILAGALQVLLQIVEMLMAFGAVHLAGPVVPVLVCLPVLAALALVSAALRVASALHPGVLVVGLIEAIATIAEQGCAALRAMTRGWGLSAIRSWRQRHWLMSIRLHAERVKAMASAAAAQQRDAVNRAFDFAAHRADLAQTAVLRESLAAMLQHYFAMLAQDLTTAAGAATTGASSEVAAHLRATFDREVASVVPTIMREAVQASAAAVRRPVSYVGHGAAESSEVAK